MADAEATVAVLGVVGGRHNIIGDFKEIAFIAALWAAEEIGHRRLNQGYAGTA